MLYNSIWFIFVENYEHCMMKRIVILPFLLLNLSVFSQNELSFSIGSGLVYYLGDLNESPMVTNPAFLRPSANIGLCYKATSFLNVNLQFMAGSLYADDAYANSAATRNRNLHFKSTIQEFSITGVIKPVKASKFIPYAFMGAGVFWFNPKALNGTEWVELQPLGTEGQFILNGSYPKPYSLTQAVVPLGVGAEIKVSDNIGFKLELTYHKTFTDYLDDVSTTYPDSVSLAKTANGPLATVLSYRGDGSFPGNDISRGNTSLKDSYVNITFSLLLYLRGSKGIGNGTFRFQPN